MVKAYLAGDMLKRGSQLLRSCERVDIEKLGTVELFNPMDNKEINDKATNPTAEKIFAKDTEAILESEIIIAEVDNNNVGTTSEMGQIWGLNYVMGQLNDIWESADALTDQMAEDGLFKDKTAEIHYRNDIVAFEVMRLLSEIPMKTVHWQTTDIRDTNIPESGHRRSHSLNQYLYGMMLDMGGEAKSFDEILEALK